MHPPRVLEAIDLPSVRAEGYVFQIEVTYRAMLAGFRVREVPIVFADRTAGKSKMSARIALEAMWLVPAIKRDAAAGARRARVVRPRPPSRLPNPTATVLTPSGRRRPGILR